MARKGGKFKYLQFKFCLGCAILTRQTQKNSPGNFCSYRCRGLWESRTGVIKKRGIKASATLRAKGLKRSAETRRKISDANKGRIVTEETRAKILMAMSGIKKKHTGIEMKLAEGLSNLHLRFQTQFPVGGIAVMDLAFPDQKIAVFADGCLWHACPLHFPDPSSKFPSLQKVPIRDRWQNEMLRSRGWIVLRYWEHDIKNSDRLDEIVGEIGFAVNSQVTISNKGDTG